MEVSFEVDPDDLELARKQDAAGTRPARATQSLPLAVEPAQGHTFVFLQGRMPPVVIPGAKVQGGAYEGFVRALHESYVRHKSMGGR